MAGEYVVNNFVSMDWVKKGFFVKSKRFYFASQEYTIANGETVCVFFTPSLVFMFSDDGVSYTEGTWDMGDMMRFAKEKGNVGVRFPRDYEDSYHVVMDDDGFEHKKLIEFFGFTEEQLQDMRERMADLVDYTKEVEFVPRG